MSIVAASLYRDGKRIGPGSYLRDSKGHTPRCARLDSPYPYGYCPACLSFNDRRSSTLGLTDLPTCVRGRASSRV